MKARASILILFAGAASLALANAQSLHEPAGRENGPRLGEIMLSKQWRHIKLWFAGRDHNWKLAGYELAQIKASLVEAAMLYASIPVSDVASMAGPIGSIDEAIQAQDHAAFVKAFGELTSGCNGCHRDMGREFIAIKTPADSPFTNQVFGSSAKP